MPGLKEPEKIKVGSQSYYQEKVSSFNKLHFVWVYARKQNYFDQVIPIFKGWELNIRSSYQTGVIKKTVETYLPPLTTKVTEFSTIQKYITYLQGLAADVNMPYVNITLDVGAAINTYKTVWSLPEQYKNVIIHLGSFHFLKENFQILGSLVTGTGFEDAVYQSGLCTSGSLQGVIAGSHYNRAWSVHLVFFEALERLLLTRFLVEKKPRIPVCFKNYCVDTNSTTIDKDFMKNSSKILEEYEFRKQVSTGAIGKTAQFWMIYLNQMRMQMLALTAVQENDLKMLICSWKSSIPFYFTMNKMNYARYGSYYVHVLMNIDEHYPGMKEYLQLGGISAQPQTSHSVRTATDQRGEQTINKDAKTTGNTSETSET